MATRDKRNVFLNIPFDKEYEPLFEALVFTITACGYKVRCALEEDDSGNIRLDKLENLIRISPNSIHDLSRIELSTNGYPRFNMPFELGIAVGAKRFGASAHKKNKIKVIIAEQYKLPVYLSDLGGNDPATHHNNSEHIIKIIRNFLHTTPEGAVLPGARALNNKFLKFKEQLPALAKNLEHEISEVNILTSYLVYIHCVSEHLMEINK